MYMRIDCCSRRTQGLLSGLQQVESDGLNRDRILKCVKQLICTEYLVIVSTSKEARTSMLTKNINE